MSDSHVSGRFGNTFGGRWVSESIWDPLEKLGVAFDRAANDPAFQEALQSWMSRIGRPTPLVRLDSSRGEGTLVLKREDLLQGGSMCTISAVGQALLAREMGKTGVMGETSTGDFGLALASAAAALDLEATLFVGRADAEVECRRISAMKLMGARVEIVDSPNRGRTVAAAEALREWSVYSGDWNYCASGAAMPDPFPRMTAYFNEVAGAEAVVQLERMGFTCAYVVCPVGTGGLASGLFSAFVEDEGVQLVGVQAAGDASTDIREDMARPGIAFGTRSLVLQSEDGNLMARTTCAGGLAVPVLAPQHAHWWEDGRALYAAVDDEAALRAVESLAARTGILVSVETGHALAYAQRLRRTLDEQTCVLVAVTGGGMQDLERVQSLAGEPS